MLKTNDVVLLNELKHHLGYISWYIQNGKGQYGPLLSDLKTIGHSQMDLYTGELPVSAITRQITMHLKQAGLLEKDLFFAFLDQIEGFTVQKLSDNSLWVLRKGDHPQKFVHLHPARCSPHSVRIKASTLKTVIAVMMVHGAQAGLDEINEVRINKLKLSPIKSINSQTGIGKMLRLIALSTQSLKRSYKLIY